MNRKPWYSYLYVQSPIAKIAWGIVGVIISIIALLVQGLVEVPRMQAQTESWEGRSVENGAAIYFNNCSDCHGFNGEGSIGRAPALNSKYFFEQRLIDIEWAGSMKSYVSLTVHAGRPSKVTTQWTEVMPTWGSDFGGPLKPDAVGHVVNYVLNWEESALAQSDDEDPWQPFLDVTGENNSMAVGPIEGEPRAPQELFTTMTCGACHNLDLDQTEDEQGPLAPNMRNLHETAGSKVEGQDAANYVYTSIVNPSAYVNAGYEDNMNKDFAERMSDEEIVDLVEWLLDPNRERS